MSAVIEAIIACREGRRVGQMVRFDVNVAVNYWVPRTIITDSVEVYEHNNVQMLAIRDGGSERFWGGVRHVVVTTVYAP